MEHGNLKSYVVGFILSIVLTLGAYFVVVEQLLPIGVLIGTIVGMGIAQALIQLILFLHLGREPKPRWNLLVFLFMALIAIIVVFGSLWIVYNLNYRDM